jgi:prepilin-type N-terminal cleavage/methylation domain-containing protein
MRKTEMRFRAFSLMELLVVIAIIAIVVSITFPLLVRAKRTAKGAVCISNLQQIYLASELYYQDHDGWTLPLSGLDVVQPYAKSNSIFSCPDDRFVKKQRNGFPVNLQTLWDAANQTFVDYKISYAYVGVPDITQSEWFWRHIQEKSNVGLYVCQWHGDAAPGDSPEFPNFNPPMEGIVYRVSFDGHFVKAKRQDPPNSFAVDDLFFHPWRRVPGGGLIE